MDALEAARPENISSEAPRMVDRGVGASPPPAMVSPRFGEEEVPGGSVGEEVVPLQQALNWLDAKDLGRVVIVGPLPRPLHDEGLQWERTRAYQLERALLRRVAGFRACRVVPLGRQLTAMSRTSERTQNGRPGTRGGHPRRARGVHIVKRDLGYWAPDGVHLVNAGYGRLSSKVDQAW